jgi:predicted MFS family arabinose efflux permease
MARSGGDTGARYKPGVASHSTFSPRRASATPDLGAAELRRFWPAVVACFCVAVFAWGFGFYGLAVFVGELHHTHGWPVSTIGAASTVFYLSGAFLIPFVHQTLRRTGPRVLLIGGALFLGLGAIGFSNAAAPWQLFVAGLLMAIGWAASSGPAISTALALWFDSKRGLAISLALNGASASGFTVAPLLLRLSQSVGLKLAVIEAVLAGWLILIPIILWGARPRGAPAHTEAVGDRRNRSNQWALLRDRHFWSVALPFALAIAAQVGFIVHMVALLMPLLGTAGTSLAVTISSLAAMAGRLAVGTVIDRLPRRGTAAICFASQACGLALVLLAPHSVIAVYAGVLLFGLSVGNVITLPAIVVHTEFDAASFGAIVGLSGAIAQFVLALAPGAFGLLHDATGNYDAVLLVCMALQVVAAGLVLYRGGRGNGRFDTHKH